MQIIADALVWDLFIYQWNGTETQVLNFKHPEADWVVHVKYAHDNLYPRGNHYNTIVNIIKTLK